MEPYTTKDEINRLTKPLNPWRALRTWWACRRGQQVVDEMVDRWWHLWIWRPSRRGPKIDVIGTLMELIRQLHFRVDALENAARASAERRAEFAALPGRWRQPMVAPPSDKEGCPDAQSTR